MQTIKKAFFAAPLLACLGMCQFVGAETWTDSTGKFTVEAKFLSASGGKVYLEKEDGTRIAVPIDKLSKESYEQAKQMYNAAISGTTPTENTDTTPLVPDVAIASGGDGQSKLPADPTAKQTAEIIHAAATQLDFVTLWDSLPAKYQNDVEKLVQSAASAIDTQTWNNSMGLLTKVNKIVGEKKPFFMGNALIGPQIKQAPNADAIWDAAAELIAAYATSTLTDHNAMKSFSMDSFIAKDIEKMRAAFQKISTLTAELEGSPFEEINNITVEVVNETPTGATLRVTQDGNVDETQLVKVDNRWLPKEMVDEWDQGMQEAQAGIAMLATPMGQQQLAEANKVLQQVHTQLDAFANANSQAEFDAAVGMASMAIMSMMGGLGGGPGGPGPGGFGPGGPGGFPGGDDAFPGFDDADDAFPGADDAFPGADDAFPGFDE